MTRFQTDVWVWVDGEEEPKVEWVDPAEVLDRAGFLRTRGQIRRGVTCPVRRLEIDLFQVYVGVIASWEWAR